MTSLQPASAEAAPLGEPEAKAGHRVLGYTDPERAAQAAERTAVDAAILDIMMPGRSGYDLLGALRSDPRTQLLPVLFLSSLDSAPERVRGLR